MYNFNSFCKNHSYECKTFNCLFLEHEIFYLPDYQRHFVWNLEQISLLIDTFERSQKNEPIWLGSVLLSKTEKGIKIIDGQQRIITMFLLFKIVGLFPDEKKIKIIRSAEYQKWIGLSDSGNMLDDMVTYLAYGKEKETEKVKKINDFIKAKVKRINVKEEFKKVLKKIHVSINWIDKAKYEYFENLNSRSVKLTTAEQCLGLLVDFDPELYYKNFKIINWIHNSHRLPIIKAKDFKGDGSNFFQVFIKIYCKKPDIKNFFINFRNFILNKNISWIIANGFRSPIDFFYKFLLKTYEFFEKRSKTMTEKYLEKICCQNFWWWYIEIKLINNDKLEQVFNDRLIWFDIGKAVWSFKKTFSPDRHCSFLQREVKDRDYIFINFYNTYIKKKLFLNISKINTLAEACSATSRIKLIIFLVNYWIAKFTKQKVRQNTINKKITDWLNNNNFLDDFFFKYYKFEIEYLLPQKFEDIYKKNNITKKEIEKLEQYVSSLSNLILLSKKKNYSIRNQTVEYKINTLFNENELEERTRDIFNNVNDSWKISKHNFLVDEKLKSFFDDREKRLMNAIYQINETVRTKLNFGEFISSLDPKVILQQKEFTHIDLKLWKKSEEYYWLKSFTLKGIKAGAKRRLPFNDRDRKQIRDLRLKYSIETEINILGFYASENSIYKYKKSEWAINVQKGESSLHFNENWIKL